MKQAATFLFLFFISVLSAHAQETADEAYQAYSNAMKVYDEAVQQMQRVHLREQKREIIKQLVSLSSEQSKTFWPIYDKYEAETIKINDTRIALITDYIHNRSELSPEKAAGLVNRVMDVQLQRLQSKRAYVKELGKVLTAKQALRLLLLENQLDVQVDAQIAAQIPLQ